MKKLIIALFSVISLAANAQISNLPYFQGFESTFQAGTNIEFLPNFFGNEVAASNRIYHEGTAFHSGAFSCGVVPITTFTGEILVRMNLAAYANVYVDFWAASLANGTGTRSDIVTMSTSIDNGSTYGVETLIGDSIIFANANTSWATHRYIFPYYTANNTNVILKIKVGRGNGTGTTAKFLMDDMQFNFSATDITPPTVLSAVALTQNQIRVAFSEPLNLTGENVANYAGIPTISSATRIGAGDTVLINLTSPLVEGQWYTMNVASIEDASANAMQGSQNFTFAFNDNTGNVKITEINYNNPGNDSLEFVEIRNLDTQPINVGGWKWARGLTGMMPSGLILQAGDYAVFSESFSRVSSFFSINALPLIGTISNGGMTIAYTNSLGVLIDSVQYSSLLPWDTMANGHGPSLVLCNESSNNDVAANWAAATTFVGLFNTTDSIFANPMNNCALTAGVNELSPVFGCIVFPNPATESFSIRLISSNFTETELSVYDISGRKIYSERLSIVAGENTRTLSVRSFLPGFYFIDIAGQSLPLIISK